MQQTGTPKHRFHQVEHKSGLDVSKRQKILVQVCSHIANQALVTQGFKCISDQFRLVHNILFVRGWAFG